jgi:hypothetical protein
VIIGDKMKYQGIESPLDPDYEAIAIKEFLHRYWSIKSKKPILGLVNHVLNEGIRLGITSQERKTQEEYKNYNLSVDFLNKQRGYSLEHRCVTLSTFKQTLKGDELIESLVRLSKRKYGLSAKPKSYDRFVQKYKKTQTWGDTEKEAEKLVFNGAPWHYSMEWSFTKEMNGAQIVYEEKSQGNKPLNIMMYSILKQGATIGMLCVEKKYGTEISIVLDGVRLLSREKDKLEKKLEKMGI